MPSVAETLLEQGFDSLTAVHGETMTWRSGSGVVMSNHGEAVTTEAGKAVESGDGEEIEFEGIFDSAYALESPSGFGVATLAIAVIVKSSLLPDAARNDVIARGDETYYVIDVRPDGLGVVVLILSKQIH